MLANEKNDNLSASAEGTERVILVGVDSGAEAYFDACMEELEKLAEACQMEAVGILTQKTGTIHRATYVGSGKVEEIAEAASALEVDVIIFYDSLSPAQLRNLQSAIGKPVMDRVALILDIFERRAQTREAKCQVEVAKLQYMLPRLIGLHEALTRQGGTSGSMSSRGVGEKKLELDRRKINRRIDELKRDLADIAANRELMRKKRSSARIPLVSLVGYTNAGKSTLLNAMIDTFMAGEAADDGGVAGQGKKVFVCDMLFATLDTTVRRIECGNNRDFLLSDTVGFIHNLPPGLIKAFRSTLEEVKNADLLLHVVDYADEQHREHMQDTLATLRELGAAHIPLITVYNKADLCMDEIPFVMDGNRIYMAAGGRIGITELAEMIVGLVYDDYVEAEFLIPYDEGGLVSYFMETAEVKRQEYLAEGCVLSVSCHRADRDKYEKYLVRGLGCRESGNDGEAE